MDGTAIVEPAPAGAREPFGRRCAAVFPRTVVLAFASSRVLAGLGLILGGSPSLSSLTAGAMVSWDGSWYRVIAEQGYGPPPLAGQQSPWPFFPLYPGVVRALVEAGVPTKAAMVLISHAAFLVALAGLHRLAGRHGGPAVSRLAVWGVAFFPYSAVFSMGYPSSIFLAATVWGFWFLEQRRDVAAAALLAVATAVRPNGAVVAAAIAIGLLVTARRDPGVARRVAVLAAPSAAAFAGWCALVWHWTGSPLTFWDAKHAWDEVTIVEFLATPPQGALPHVVWGTLAVAIVTWAALRRTLPAAWGWFAAVYLLAPLAVGVVGLGRYAGECFPVFVAGAQAAAPWPPWAHRLLLAVTATSMLAVTVLMARFRFPP